MKIIDESMCKNGFHEGKFLLNSLQLPGKAMDIWYECDMMCVCINVYGDRYTYIHIFIKHIKVTLWEIV